MVDIFAPINSYADAEALVERGAEELYCGVIPDEWLEQYRSVKPPNRRANEHSQVSGFDELQRISALCEETGTALYVTLNSHFYSERQVSMLEDLVAELETWPGVTGYIIADVHFMRRLAETHPDAEILVSTGATVFNAQTAHFVRDLGADGIHLPRHLTVEEIVHIAREAPADLDLYAFVLNRNCMNVDGNCTLLHNPPIDHEDVERIPCFQTFSTRSLEADEDLGESRLFPEPRRDRDQACGLCALYRFEQAGLAGVKMVGRGLETETKTAQVELIDRVRDRLSDADSAEGFSDAVEPIVSEYGIDCSLDSCYYPTVMES